MFSQIKTNSTRRSLKMSHKIKIMIVLLATLTTTLWLTQTAHGAPTDIQPANQIPNLPPSMGSINSEPSSMMNSHSHQHEAQQQQMHPMQPLQKLPKINIYINNSQIKKLLGVDKRINYVTNGNIDTYPFGFTIPLGFNQSDMIFTWQNLGQTSVNYSISLVIGNMDAVEPPIINITRSGLIPMHEQVFKITLPCSGRMTDEVDVQVLINITGYVSAADEELSGVQQPELGNATSADALMQADGGVLVDKMRLVSHTLAIKRKKICTQNPISVQAMGQTPPNTAAPAPRLPHVPVPDERPAQGSSGGEPLGLDKWPTKPSGFRAPTTASQTTLQTPLQRGPVQDKPTPPSEPDSFSSFSTAYDEFEPRRPPNVIAHIDFGEKLRPHQQPGGPSVMHGAHEPPHWRMKPPPVDREISNDILGKQQQPQQILSAVSTSGNSPLVFTLIGLSLLISIALIVVAILGSSTSSFKKSPLDKLSQFTGNMLKRAPGSSPTMVTNHHHHQNIVVANNSKCKSPIAGGIISIGSLRGGQTSGNSKTSSVSGLSAISGQSKSQLQYGSNCYYSNYQQPTRGQQQHQYQQPATADLLGTGYQCHQQTLPAPQYPIYHIATNNTAQTTRLIWNQGNGTSSDGFTIDGGSYMPSWLSAGSNVPRSDHSGSLYQTIN